MEDETSRDVFFANMRAAIEDLNILNYGPKWRFGSVTWGAREIEMRWPNGDDA